MKSWLFAFALGSLVLAAPIAQEHDHSAPAAAKPAAAPAAMAEHRPEIFCGTMKTGQLCSLGTATLLGLTPANREAWLTAVRTYNREVNAAITKLQAQAKTTLSPAQVAGSEQLVCDRDQPSDQPVADGDREAGGGEVTDYRRLERQLSSDIGLTRRPVAVAFRDAPPPGVPPFKGTVPSGCSFWRLAAEGATFYTVPADHYNCPIGAYTHNIPLPPDARQGTRGHPWVHGRNRLRAHGGSARHSRAAEIARRRRLRAARRHAGRSGRGALLGAGGARDAAAGSRDARRRRFERSTRSDVRRAWRCRRRWLAGWSRAPAVSAIASTPRWPKGTFTRRCRAGTWRSSRKRLRPSARPTPSCWSITRPAVRNSQRRRARSQIGKGSGVLPPSPSPPSPCSISRSEGSSMRARAIVFFSPS